MRSSNNLNNTYYISVIHENLVLDQLIIELIKFSKFSVTAKILIPTLSHAFNIVTCAFYNPARLHPA